MKNKPRIRFKGFAEDWEQRKLSDITDVIMGQSPSSKNYTDNPNDNILVQGNADLKDGKVIPRLWTKEITKTIDKDGIILTVRAPVGDVAKTDYKVVLGRGVAGIKGNDFIYQFLQKLQYNRHWVSLSSGSTFESINSNDIKDLIIDIPSIEEQNKISMLLNNVNSIITLHQRKLEKLKLVKKALLQKLFPKNGSQFPEIRFKGFTDTWEQRKFSDITYLSGIKNKENKPYESYSISNEFGFIPQDEQFENGGTMKTADKSMYYIVSKNSFAYNPARINVGSIGYYDKPDNVIVSSLYEVFKTTDIVNDKFLWHWFKSNQFNRLIEKYQEGGVRLYFYYDKLCKGTIELPAIKEQNKISNLLDDLDIYITLHQRKLDKLQDVKKGLLQKMFV